MTILVDKYTNGCHLPIWECNRTKLQKERLDSVFGRSQGDEDLVMWQYVWDIISSTVIQDGR